ncbi:MAG: cytochrome c4 [Candidatus Sericytochromatia bacterium]|nr:MAG: cytochrome c4 [Candidatus Sericytochromatia bacterium]
MILTEKKIKFERISNKQKPFIISGPCSAETSEQVIRTCVELSKTNVVDLLRAGVWKPRTKPDTFEGVGEEALKWLKEASKITKIPVAVEVANSKHVELALKYQIDVLWIGARTTVNPFSVQEIADSLKGVNVPVMVKNPINPDIELWIGAIERIIRAGIKNIAAIHRGFSSYEKTLYRNKPYWEIPIELRRRYPNIMLICDPSHISGSRDLLQSISQKAMDLNFDGLMIESHINPDIAWSDSKQQVTPIDFKKIIDNLILRKDKSTNNEFNNTLDVLREKIDNIDLEILDLIEARMKIVEEIGKYKKDNNITIFQPERWRQIINSRTEIGIKKNLSEKFIKEVFEVIHKESIKKQYKIMNYI